MTAPDSPTAGGVGEQGSESDAPLTPGGAGAFCADCLSLMVEDNGAGHLCPVCDEHPPSECGDGFPCSGFDGKPCVLNTPLGSTTPPGVSP